jgi:hypothetical protein
MGKVSLYLLLIFTYLGLSKSLKTDENYFFVEGKDSFKMSHDFIRAPLSVILLDSYSKGIIFKTYFHKYRVIRVFSNSIDVRVHTSKEFWNENKNYLGMSIYRLKEGVDTPQTTPLPPGSSFVGKLIFGSWSLSSSGDWAWKFHRSYRDLPELLGWGKWRPNRDFEKTLKEYIKRDIPFFGPANEFGTQGPITLKNLKRIQNNKKIKRESFLDHLKKIFSFPDREIRR